MTEHVPVFYSISYIKEKTINQAIRLLSCLRMQINVALAILKAKLKTENVNYFKKYIKNQPGRSPYISLKILRRLCRLSKRDFIIDFIINSLIIFKWCSSNWLYIINFFVLVEWNQRYHCNYILNFYPYVFNHIQLDRYGLTCSKST